MVKWAILTINIHERTKKRYLTAKERYGGSNNDFLNEILPCTIKEIKQRREKENGWLIKNSIKAV